MPMSKETLGLENMLKDFVNGELDLTLPLIVDDEYYEKNQRTIITDSEKYEMIRRGITAEEAFNIYIDYSIEQGNRKNTLDGKIKRLKTFVYFLKNYEAEISYYHCFNEIEAKVIGDYLSSRTRKKISMHASSSFSILKAFFNYLTKEKIFVSNPMSEMDREECKKVGVESSCDIDHLTQEQLRTIVSSLSMKSRTGIRLLLVIYLMIDTGIQPYEITNLKTKNVNLEKRILFIEDSEGMTLRQVEISNTTAAIISKYILHASANKYKTEFLLKGLTKNEKISSRGITVGLRRLGDRLGIKLSATLLRDTFAVKYLENTKDSITLAYILGISIYHVNARYKNYTSTNHLLLGDHINGN